MQAVATKLYRTRFLTRALSAVALSSSFSLSKSLSSPRGDATMNHATNTCLTPLPWSATQHRGTRVQGVDVRPGNVIQKKDCIYQLELRDVDSRNKTSQRLGTEETVDIPKHVTCTIKEAQPPIKGIAATPDDGNTVENYCSDQWSGTINQLFAALPLFKKL